MALQIIAYSGLTALRRMEADELRRSPRGGHAFVVHPQFPGHAPEVDPGILYSATESFSFNTGSYSAYVRWLEQLARLVGIASIDLFWQRPKRVAFAELMDFVDCSATIGTAMCAKLAGDFADFASRAARHPDTQFRDRYFNWKRALEIGADRGCVALRPALPNA
jgi:hypothetical protein